jgi:very-short-patch-repair endonuclease
MPSDIAACIEAWRKQLLDTTKRNRLINFKAGRTGGIALVHPDPDNLWHSLVTGNGGHTFAWKGDLIDLPEDRAEASRDSEGALTLFDPRQAPEPLTGQDILDRCRHSPRLRPGHLLTDLPDRMLAARLTRLALNAHESLTEQGVAILYVAFGFLRWYESPDSQVEIRSPLLLVPVRLERDSVEAPWRLQAAEEDILPNHTLRQLLTTDFRLSLPVPEDNLGDADEPAWRLDYFGEVERCVRHLGRWDVLDEAALGTFSFQKLATWEDLARSRDRIEAHDLCRAIAGAPGVALRCPADLPKAEDLDREADPKQTFHILDADSSQHEAIAAVTRGASLVLDGPPGTGKSQTIANLIAEYLAAGKTVLFVSEKAAALEVVQRRLQDHGLADFCLACHSHKANKREVVEELGRCLSLEPGDFRDPSEELQRLSEIRRQLNDYVRELHAPRQPLGMTVYKVHGELARLTRLTSTSRCPVPKVLERDAAYLRQLVDLLARLPDCRTVIEGHDRHPWRGCRTAVYSQTLRDDIRHHFGRLAECLRPILQAAEAFHRHGFGEANPTRGQWFNCLEAARSVLTCPPVPAGWFTDDVRATAEAVVRLDQLTQAYRRALAALPEFAPAALRQEDVVSLAKEALPAEGRPRLVRHAGDTVRSQCPRLAAIDSSLRQLQQRAATVEQATRQVAELLRDSLPSQPVKSLRSLAKLADHVARLKPVRRSWWDPARRQELRGVIARCQEEARAAAEARAQLTARLSPQAFAPESAPRAAEGSRFRSFLARLLPRWWSLKGEIATWYTGEVPKTAALLDDLGKLAAYHRRLDFGRQVRQQYATDLILGADGEPDWHATLGGLDAVDGLKQFGKIPAPLQALLSEGAGLDRPALAAAAEQLAQQAAALRRELEAAARDYDLGEVTDGAPHHVRVTSLDLVAWLERQAAAVEQQAALLERVSRLLAEGRDLPVDSLPARLGSLIESVELRAEINPLCGRIWKTPPPPAVEDRDWSTLAGAAAALLRLLDRWRGPLPTAVVKALIVPEVRSQVTEAVRQSDAARAAGFEDSWRFLARLFDVNQDVSTGIRIEQAPLADLQRWLSERVADAHRLHEWALFCDVEREMAQAGVTTILDEVRGGQVKLQEAPEAFRARFLGLWLDAVYERSPALRQFGSDSRERLIERFRELDRAAIKSAAARIRHFQLTRPERPRPVGGDAPASSELGTLLREVNKKRRHLPLRKLFAAIPTLLPRLKPCLMMSPLAVSTYLDCPDLLFDLVIFDEASQVRPHDAVCAIYRGRQLVVAGDQKQLPPTSFFDRVLECDEVASEEAEGDAGGLEDFESILDVCCTLGLPRRRLRWHYRSRREGLIAFANHHIYGNELVTFPSIHDVAGNPAITFDYVADGRWKTGASGGFNLVEARHTAELVLAHFRESPDHSLGVIAFSQRQQMCILDELERLRRDNPDLEEFFGEARNEPFFVKNLENVQGDERDVIFLCIGYGPLEGIEPRRVAMRFGPLNQQGGERRLNVAITRARERITVVSSMRAHDIDLSRTGAAGVRLLRAYLDYAERGSEALRSGITGAGDRTFDSPFEQEVFEELARHGLTIHSQVGCSGFRIDLAVVDPREPGRYLLGVECDGTTYHRSATARDRDRLRQEVLERLGWSICRIWSTDWLRDRAGQVLRVQLALERAKRAQTASPSTPATPPARRPAEDHPVAADSAKGGAAGPPQATTDYESIDDVPEPVLEDLLCRALQTFGATEDTDLIQSVTRQLGFKRTGKRIQARIEECLEGLIRAGQVCRTADQRLLATSGSRAASM